MNRNLMWTLGVLGVCASVALANSAPVVSNVTASQRGDDSKLVDIHYDLVDDDGDPCTVWVSVSDDGGATWKVPAKSFTGAIGMDQSPGTNKEITWDVGLDFPGTTGSFRVRVWADDGNGPGAKVLVPAGWFPYQNTSNPNDWVFVDTFLIDKYEVTDHFYCQFLNAPGNDDHWVSSQKITRQGDPGSYYYTVRPGYENHPVWHVNYYDAVDFAEWRSNLEDVTYRLPKEREWEKAAAWDPVQNRYYTYGYHSDSIGCTWCNYYPSPTPCFNEPIVVGFFDGNGGRHNAKSYYGCYDMSGNLYEWTGDMLDDTYRAVRGGCYQHNASYCRCASRSGGQPYDRHQQRGFRLVLDVD